MSVLSGIKDFRGKNGLYKTMDAEKIFDLNLFMKDPSYTLDNGDRIMIVNDMPTSFGEYASLKYDDLGTAFEYLEKALDEGRL